MTYDERHEKAWQCWEELSKLFKPTKCYFIDGKLHIGNGCGGDFVKVIEKYL